MRWDKDGDKRLIVRVLDWMQEGGWRIGVGVYSRLLFREGGRVTLVGDRLWFVCEEDWGNRSAL